MCERSSPLGILFAFCLFSGGLQAHGFIQAKGSETLLHVAQAWAEAYQAASPNMIVAVRGGGSGIGIAGLLNGVVDIANASRKIKDEELEWAEERGIHVSETLIGYDALAVYVHKDNPVTSLSVAQLKEIFGVDGKFTHWSDLGVIVPGCKGRIVPVGRQESSGSYTCFSKAVLGKEGEFRRRMLDLPASEDVVDRVAKRPCAIGYSGLAYATDQVRMICISGETDTSCVDPAVKTANDRSYPLARPLFLYTRANPKKAVAAYVEWILSDAGQCLLSRHGFAPLRDDIVCE